jgi:signal recognition particle GTPase
VQEVNQLLKQYLEMRKLFQQMGPSPSKGQLRRLLGR